MKTSLCNSLSLGIAVCSLSIGSMPARSATIMLVTDRAEIEQGTDGLAGYLRFLGYEVEVNLSPGNASEFRTLDAAKIARLESKDLVIVHRATDSGTFDDGTEPADWNMLRVPVLCMSPYLVRTATARWNWMPGDIASINPFTDQEFVLPTHPIVAGLEANFFAVARNYNVMNGVDPGNGTVIAKAPTSGASIVAWPEPPGGGATLYYQGTSGQTYRARRVYCAIHNYHEAGAWTDISENGKVIVARAVQFAMTGVVGELPPQIRNLAPANGTLFFPAANGISFNVTNAAPIAVSDISLVVNGVDVSSSLVVGADPLNRTVLYTGLSDNAFYTASIVVTNVNGQSTADLVFDTLDSTTLVIEAEDYDYDSAADTCSVPLPRFPGGVSGAFIDNPAPGAYAGLIGELGFDYFRPIALTNDVYRCSLEGTNSLGFRVSTDSARAVFASAGFPDHDLTQVVAGQWQNYTRTIPDGDYRAYLRANASAAPRVRLDKVVSGLGTSNQNTLAVGSFAVPAGAGFTYVPLTDAAGEAVSLKLSGVTSLRLTALSANNDLNVNFLVLVPVGAADLPPSVAAVTPLPGEVDVLPESEVSVSIVNRATGVVPASVRLFFNGTEVSGSAAVIPSAVGVEVRFAPGLLPSLSVNTVRVEFIDDGVPASNLAYEWTFRVLEYVTLPAGYAGPPNSGLDRGFNLKVRKLRNDATGIAGNLDRVENHLRDLLIDPNTSAPYVNEAAGPNLDGTAAEPAVINYQQTAAAEGFFYAANGKSDQPFPNVPTSPAPDYLSLEVITYLELSAGMHRLGIRSDDGFKVTAGPVPADTNLLVSMLNAGRGAGGTSDTIVVPIRRVDALPSTGATEFEFRVLQAGVYAFRVIYFEGTGGASLEFYSVNRATGRRILVNDPAEPEAVVAYQQRASNPPPAVTYLFPAPGAIDAPQSFTLQATIANTDTAVVPASVRLWLDDIDVTGGATLTPLANGLTISYPAGVFPIGAAPVAMLVYSDDAVPARTVTNTWTFTVADVVPPVVTIVSPANGARFPVAPADIVVTATASDNESVALVEFFVNRTNRIGQATASPYTATLRDAPEGRYLLTAVATDSAGLKTTSPQVGITVGNPATNVLFVVGNTTLNAGDAAVYNLLVGKGANVSLVSGPASATDQADGKALVVVSSTITSGDVSAKFRDVAVPVLQWEQANQDDYLMTLDAGTDRGTLAGQSQINIINDTHPLAAGLPAGITTVTTSAQTFSWGVPQGEVTIIATISTNSAWACLYGYERGAAMLGGFVAPDRRVMIFLEDATAGALTSEGTSLVSAAIDWALNLEQGAASPILINPQKSGDTFSVSLTTEAGRTYLLQSKNALSDPIWVTVQTVPGTGGTVTLTDLNATAATRFYRVEVQ